MRLTTHNEAGIIMARIDGRFDAYSVPDFNLAVRDRVDAQTPNVVVDLARSEFIDSTALAALVAVSKRTIEHGGELVLASVPESARVVLELTRLDRAFRWEDSLTEARKRLADSERTRA